MQQTATNLTRNSHDALKKKIMQIKSIRSHKEISQQPTKSRKIPQGNHMRKMCSTKHKVAQGLCKKKRQSSFTVNARQEGGRALIKKYRGR
jgi:hypothetical protein